MIIVNSFSKNWAMTGWRLGWMVHPPSLTRHIAMAVQYSTSGCAAFVQHAGVAAIQQGEPFVALHPRLRRAGHGHRLRRPGAASARASRPAARSRACTLFFKVDGLPDSRDACREILEATKVGLAPGAFFGKGSEGFLRLCVSREPDSLREAMTRLTPFLS